MRLLFFIGLLAAAAPFVALAKACDWYAQRRSDAP